MVNVKRIAKGALLLLGITGCLSACGGGGGSGRSDGGSSGADFGCDGGCAHQSLSAAEVSTILGQAVSEATLKNVAATIAVIDRVGNVLAVYQMPGAVSTARIDGQIGASGGLEGANVPTTLAAISKAGTGAYLSSQGNAFSTRTASQIIQENFNPGEHNQPGGPLFGVQFSQLPCSDINTGSGGQAGPKPLPLGLSADPGGLPLYKSGDLVGGVGVEIDGVYRLDRDISDNDDDIDERVALAASLGFEAPSERVASNISAGGKSLRYTDLRYSQLEASAASAAAFDTSHLVAVSGYSSNSVRDGVPFGSIASGVADSVRAGVASGILVSPSGAERFPARGGSSLGATEVNALLDSALVTASRARAAIRRPLDSGARVSIWVVDSSGDPLGFTRSQDAPVFGIDVALQKARTAAFFSSADVLTRLRAVGGADWSGQLGQFVAGIGSAAISARAVGNLSRPFYVDGINGHAPGPLSLPFPGSAPGSSWSPFNTGFQLDLVIGRFLASVASPSSGCSAFGSRLANGIQIFPGAVPLYRGHTLIGALGVSGDGIDQDDMISFYGASHKGLASVGHDGLGDPVYGFNAPPDIRADTLALAVPDTRLRYVNCPEGPFLDVDDQNVCDAQ